MKSKRECIVENSLKDEIHVSVFGKNGIGKSTVAYEIAKALTDKGIHVEIRDGWDNGVNWVFKQDTRLNVMKDKVCVIIDEQNVSGN